MWMKIKNYITGIFIFCFISACVQFAALYSVPVHIKVIYWQFVCFIVSRPLFYCLIKERWFLIFTHSGLTVATYSSVQGEMRNMSKQTSDQEPIKPICIVWMLCYLHGVKAQFRKAENLSYEFQCPRGAHKTPPAGNWGFPRYLYKSYNIHCNKGSGEQPTL